MRRPDVTNEARDLRRWPSRTGSYNRLAEVHADPLVDPLHGMLAYPRARLPPCLADRSRRSSTRAGPRALEPVAGDIAAMGDFLRAEIAAGRGYLPAGDKVLRAFTTPLADVRVLVVGQDPYPTPGHPVGLCVLRRRQLCGRCRRP